MRHAGDGKRKVLLGVLVALLAVGVGASCALGGLTAARLSAQEEVLRQLLAASSPEEGGRVTQEDDVTVAGSYTIRSTKALSDAYRAGDLSGLNQRERDTVDMAAQVLSQTVTDAMTPFEKEKAVYDWMCAHVAHEGTVTVAIPVGTEESSTPYGVLKYHQAVCVGYATTFRLMMQMLDIPCMVVHNDYHSWNLVELDGGWYHTDLYSDAGRGTYENFNMTDGMCQAGHEWDRDFFPAADQLDYCYAYRTAQSLDDVYQLPALVRRQVEAGGSAGMNFLVNQPEEEWYPVVSQMLDEVYNAVNEYAFQQGREITLSWSVHSAGQDSLLQVSLAEAESQPGQEALSQEQLDRIAQAVAQAFGEYIPVE